MENKISCIGFKINYTRLNVKLMENDKKGYDICIIQVYVAELNDGYIVDKIYKTSTKGTKVSYKSFDKNTIKDYICNLNSLIDKFNAEYDESIKHLEITFK